LLDLAPGGEAEDLPLAIAPQDDERSLAIVRTSGSSGYPKGVVLSRRAFVAAAVGSAKNLGWQEEDRWLLSLPVAHVGGLSIITRCLLARRTVVVAQPGGFAAQRLADDLVRWRISLLSLVPTMMRRLLELSHWSPPASLRALLLGGAVAPLDVLERAMQRGVPILTTWGLTEACSQVTTQPYGSVHPGEFDCGPPLDGMEVRIDEGRIFIRGPQLLSGYLSSTAPSPWDAEGWFATGDSGCLDAEGRLHVFGRRDEVIITGGENVHPQEVEAVLLAHAEIAEALVFGLEDADWGQVVVAVLVPAVFGAAVPATLKEAKIRSYVEEHLASFKRPRRLFWWQELPKTTTGKVDREGTRRRCMELL
jgi:O-succinylbenzoic acid--CoA ligase